MTKRNKIQRLYRQEGLRDSCRGSRKGVWEHGQRRGSQMGT